MLNHTSYSWISRLTDNYIEAKVTIYSMFPAYISILQQVLSSEQVAGAGFGGDNIIGPLPPTIHRG